MNNEFDAISRLFQKRVPFVHPLTSLANGDDASVHQLPSDSELVVSTDTAVSGVHWPEDMPLNIAADRAVKAALSDLAAMGAQASWIWLAVMAKDSPSLQAMSDGIVQACLEHQVELAGGDTVRSPTNIMNVTVGGLLPKNSAMTRSAAQAGDEIWLIGDLGLSATGLKQWLSGDSNGSFVSNFQQITPQLEKGIALRELGIKCCIDISDGLLQDAGHIAKASHVSMSITVEQLQELPAYQKLVKTEQKNTLNLMLSGGEDYALLFIAPTSKHHQLVELGALPIGKCYKGEGMKLLHHDSEVDFNIKGYDHFG